MSVTKNDEDAIAFDMQGDTPAPSQEEALGRPAPKKKPKPRQSLDDESKRQTRPTKGKTCPLPTCEQIVIGKKRYCPPHERCYECVETKALADIDKHKPSTWNAESDAFYTIFGRQASRKAHSPAIKGDPELAEKVLNDVLEKFPDTNFHPEGEPPSKRTRGPQTSRGEGMKLSSYVHSKGSEVMKSEVAGRFKWDKPMFVVRMASLRNWNQTRCDREWAQLLFSTPAELTDQEGDTLAPTRLPIPSWMTGEDKTEDRTSNFERKSIDTRGEGQALSPEAMQAAVAAASTGFSVLANPNSGVAFEAAPPFIAPITVIEDDKKDADEEAKDVVMETLVGALKSPLKSNDPPAPEIQAADDPIKTAVGGTKPLEPVAPASVPVPMVDIAITRTRMGDERQSLLRTEDTKAWKQLESAREVLISSTQAGCADLDVHGMLQERFNLFVEFMGKEINIYINILISNI